MKLLPFDLAKAQAGHPWGTRDGKKGKKIFDTERKGVNRLILLLEDETTHLVSVEGRYYTSGMESDFDLFLYEEEKKGWVVIFVEDGELDCHITKSIDDRDNSESYHKEHSIYLQTVEVEY